MNKSIQSSLLGNINYPSDVRKLKKTQLKALAKELREYLTQSVSVSGGHFSAGLGTVELTAAVHYVFNTPEDQLEELLGLCRLGKEGILKQIKEFIKV
jgi:1-deoxy-D-xylulose-5-phosphate synthase